MSCASRGNRYTPLVRRTQRTGGLAAFEVVAERLVGPRDDAMPIASASSVSSWRTSSRVGKRGVPPGLTKGIG